MMGKWRNQNKGKGMQKHAAQTKVGYIWLYAFSQNPSPWRLHFLKSILNKIKYYVMPNK